MTDDVSAAMTAAVARHINGPTIAWGRGSIYDFENPNPSVISIEDAAYALAYTVRWRGQTVHRGRRCFYGVGQHVVFGAEEMLGAGHGPLNALAFLLHEADEVVLPDMPGPVKPLLPGYRELANKQGKALLDRFEITIPDPDLCKRWDMRMMVTEKRDLMLGHDGDYFQTAATRLSAISSSPRSSAGSCRIITRMQRRTGSSNSITSSRCSGDPPRSGAQHGPGHVAPGRAGNQAGAEPVAAGGPALCPLDRGRGVYRSDDAGAFQ